MTAITYRKPAVPAEVLVRAANGILLRVSVDTGRGRQDGASNKGRKVRKLLRALVAYQEGKKK